MIKKVHFQQLIHYFLFWYFMHMLTSLCAVAQDQQPAVNAWLYWDNKHAFNDDWALETDMHVRTSDDFEGLGNLLLRGWIDYTMHETWSAGLGYAYLGSWDEDLAAPKDYYSENRLFTQVQQKIALSESSNISQRIRLEQRFFDAAILPPSSFRSRYSLNWKRHFDKNIIGVDYFFLENEVFINLKGKALSGGKYFEQNRVYGGFGFPVFSDGEIELGSYYEVQNDIFEQTNQSIIIQLRVKTNL